MIQFYYDSVSERKDGPVNKTFTIKSNEKIDIERVEDFVTLLKECKDGSSVF